MERKGGSTTVAVTAEEVKAALPRARTVTSEEEKALRMRYGAQVERNAPLARASQGNAELEDELLLIEMQLLRAYRARPTGRAAPAAPSARNPTKDKIVRGLRKKR